MKEKTLLGAFIFSAVMVIVILFLLFFQGKITGKVIENEEKEVTSTQYEMSCSDSDNGKNYDVLGTVRYCDTGGECSIKDDSCSGKKVIEYYCENNAENSEEKECEFDCDGGKCISLVKKYTYPYVSGGGGTISAGGGGTAPAISGQIYDLGDLTSEKIVDLVKDENIKFKISGVEYSIIIKEVIQSQAAITINSRAEEFNLLVGEDNTLDLNQDNAPDAYFKIISINTITLRLKLILRPL